MPNLKLRVMTALILLPLVFAALFYLPEDFFPFVSGGFLLLAGWEWSRLAGYRHHRQQAIYVAICTGMLVIVWFIPLVWVLCIGVIAWILASIDLFRRMRSEAKTTLVAHQYGILGLVILPTCWQSLNLLCLADPRPYLLLLLLFIVWIADTAAYFVGCRWGKHKLAPTISPGKSIEGAIAGIIASMLFMIAIALWQDFSWETFLQFELLSLVASVISIIGDLFESMLKRQQGMKDSSHLLPGHGGVLDRIDSLIAAAPLFALGLLLPTLIY